MTLPSFDECTRPLPEPHLLVEPGGRIVAGNRAAASFFGLRPAGLAAAFLPDLVRTSQSTVLGLLATAAATGQAIPGRLTVAEGEAVRAYPVQAGAVRMPGEPDRTLVLLRIDTSDRGDPFLLLTRKIEELTAEVRRRMLLEAERARLLESERKARQAAEEASRLKDDFMATLSHELRTPLNAILGWATMLRTGDAGEERQELALRTIEQSARSQAQLIEDLLDFARIVGGNLRLDVQPVDVAAVVEAAVETVRPTAEVKGIRLDVILDPQAGPVSGDPSRLQQVVWNLLTNAIKFTDRGGRVQVRLERINSHVEITVTDSGEGIPADFLPHVFDRFRQGDSSYTRPHGGVGLGLSIARHIVEAHAGLIHAASDGPGEGSTFTVALPLLVYQRPPTVRVRGSHPAAEAVADVAEKLPPGVLRGLDVLVLEDHEDSRVVLISMLEKCGARVRAAASAQEARERLEEGPSDVLLADIELPGEDGYTFLRKLRADTSQEREMMPAIAITAFAGRADRLRALDAGFQMHLSKPLDPAELVAAVRAVTRER